MNSYRLTQINMSAFIGMDGNEKWKGILFCFSNENEPKYIQKTVYGSTSETCFQKAHDAFWDENKFAEENGWTESWMK